jgi:UDP-N-acetyl-D-mannosaminuronic acid dehydrogenase
MAPRLMGAFTSDVAVIGGCGHVGLPLAIAFADHGLKTHIYDTDVQAVERVRAGEMPFFERGAEEPLRRALESGMLEVSADAAAVGGAESVVVVIGTPVDEHLNPDPIAVRSAILDCEPYLSDGQLLVLRSTVYPGVTESIEQMIDSLGREVDVAFCPERIAQGAAMLELTTLPQIVGARTERAGERAEALFRNLTDSILRVTPEEAELAKLFTNTWRYIKFAIANQFFMMANDYGLDFESIRDVIRTDYPRATDLPGAGFAAGPCLLKDTMQLAAFTNNGFVLGHSAMLVNEGLPLYLVSRLERRFDLAQTTVGILGMAFKAETDDTRDSLAYKLRRILRFRARDVLCTDDRVSGDPTLLPLREVLDSADVLIIATPHPEYRELTTDKPIVDIWNLRNEGTVV